MCGGPKTCSYESTSTLVQVKNSDAYESTGVYVQTAVYNSVMKLSPRRPRKHIVGIYTLAKRTRERNAEPAPCLTQTTTTSVHLKREFVAAGWHRTLLLYMYPGPISKFHIFSHAASSSREVSTPSLVPDCPNSRSYSSTAVLERRPAGTTPDASNRNNMRNMCACVTARFTSRRVPFSRVFCITRANDQGEAQKLHHPPAARWRLLLLAALLASFLLRTKLNHRCCLQAAELLLFDELITETNSLVPR